MEAYEHQHIWDREVAAGGTAEGAAGAWARGGWIVPQTSKEGKAASALKPCKAKALDRACECFEKRPVWNLHHRR